MLPLVSISAYIFVYRAMGAPKDYEGFVVLGGAMTPFWLAVLWGMASQFYWERESGNLELYLAAPISRMSILAGMAAGSMITITTRAIAVVALGAVVFGVEFAPRSWGALGLAFVLTMAALYCMGMLGASLFLLFGREAWHMVNLFQEPIYLVSGFFFPVRALGRTIALFASLIPLTLGLDAMRQTLFPEGAAQGLLPVGLELAILAALAAVFFLLAGRALDYMENRAKREGRLTLRWQ
ncbi:MAG: ABC transporter permease [Planctomycetes bacterium]|nr:ABC transporter permease [Planctomycetota bacterium]